MTQPRIVRPGDVLMTTVRTVARFYLLRPDPALTAAARYVLAHYAAKHGIQLYAACLMSTHLHLVFRDPRAVHPDFLRDVHRNIANVVKAHRGWRGDVFGKRPSVVRLLCPAAIIDKIAYLHANPVAAGAVKYAKDWPGLCTTPRDLGAPARSVARTKLYFRADGAMPDHASLRFELPESVVAEHGEDGTLEAIVRATHQHEDKARGEVKRRGGSFAGAKRCGRVSPFKRASAYEVFGDTNPTFATKGGGRKLFFEAVRQLRAFRRGYRLALDAWQRGARDAVFPLGTWRMRVLHNVACVPPS